MGLIGHVYYNFVYFFGRGQKGKKGKELLNSPGGRTADPKTEVEVIVAGGVPVPRRGATIPRIVAPGAAA